MSESSAITDPNRPPDSGRTGLRRYLATSQTSLPRAIRWCRARVLAFSVPAPAVIVKPLAWLIVAVRSVYHGLMRVFVCEPFFKAHCRTCGKNLHTGCYLHWIQGKGDIVIGNNVIIDGKCSISFAARFSDRPVLEIGNNTGIAHDCRLVIGKRITIGRNCMIAGGTNIMDSNGHSTDIEARLAGRPPREEEIRPVTIGDGVWIGMQCIIFPGVKIGEGSVISTGSVVRTHVPPFSVVAGNPAKIMFRLKKGVGADTGSSGEGK